jgi:hypothetical protein
LLTKYRAHLLVALALFVCAFASLHPYFDAEGYCGLAGCPDPSLSSHASNGASYSTACLAAVLVAAVAAPIFGRFSWRRWLPDHRRPAEAYLSPDTPPPRV